MYQSPLVSRYASKEMSELFSEENRSVMWRRVWLALAKAQQDIGLPITREQIKEMEAHLSNIDLGRVKEIEAQVHHDVLSHIQAYGELCPSAKPIIHLGATSCDITDNGDLLIYFHALKKIDHAAKQLQESLRNFADKHKSTIVLGYTHFQPAQPTTLGLRSCLWLQDLQEDLRSLDSLLHRWKLRGLRGATGTQSSFLQLCKDEKNVENLERRFLEILGHTVSFSVTGQTYPRKFDAQITRILSGFGESLHKLGVDIRLLQHTQEVKEEFTRTQKGSSAMPYKQNPMRSERLCSLSRLLLNCSATTSQSASQQWLERSLDDSAARRVVMAQGFMTAEASLNLARKIIDALTVEEAVIERRLGQYLPFFATENILMHCVEAGGDRQELHTRLRNHATEASALIAQGKENDLFERILEDPDISIGKEDLDQFTSVEQYAGRAASLVDAFLLQNAVLVEGPHRA